MIKEENVALLRYMRKYSEADENWCVCTFAKRKKGILHVLELRPFWRRLLSPREVSGNR
jgi:hypothetical protein